MVLIVRLLLAAFCLVIVPVVATPAGAHKNHNEVRAPEEAQQNGSGAIADHAANPAAAAHTTGMEEHRPTTIGGRLISFAGRMHPFAVHFPIALFPVALVALVLARKRGEKVELIRALIVVAGAASVAAAALGWLNGGLTVTDTDTILMFHRWLGTLLGLIGGLASWWAWLRRASVYSGSMVATLSMIVALLLVQGFLGASVTHGMDHLMF